MAGTSHGHDKTRDRPLRRHGGPRLEGSSSPPSWQAPVPAIPTRRALRCRPRWPPSGPDRDPGQGRPSQMRTLEFAQKSKAPGGLLSSGRNMHSYPMDASFFRNSGKGQADFSDVLFRMTGRLSRFSIWPIAGYTKSRRRASRINLCQPFGAADPAGSLRSR